MVERLINACAAMAERYHADRARIMVIDDSDDETRHAVDRAVAHQKRRGLRIEVLRRAGREGFKAGALQYALERTVEEYIAVFDADFAPTEGFLVRAIPLLVAHPGLGIAQGRWCHLNRGYNSRTRALAIGIDAHFLIEQAARFASGFFLNFNGSGGVIRRSALIEAGGWQWDTLAEDLDASYRIQLRGYRIVYLRDLTCPAEVPPTVPAFRKQQARWACGSLRTARKLLPRLIRSSGLSWKLRLQAVYHLTQYMLHPLMYLSFLLACMVAFSGPVAPVLSALPPRPPAQGWEVVLSVGEEAVRLALPIAIIACTLAAWVYSASAVRASGRSVLKDLPSLILLALVGAGLSANNTVEAFKALIGRRAWSFERTPKYAIEGRTDDWRSKTYQVPLDLSGALEAFSALVGFGAIASALVHGQFLLALMIAAYTAGYTLVAVGTLAQAEFPISSSTTWHSRARGSPPTAPWLSLPRGSRRASARAVRGTRISVRGPHSWPSFSTLS